MHDQVALTPESDRRPRGRKGSCCWHGGMGGGACARFNNEATTAHCSLFMLTCPSAEVGPSSRWGCAELANPRSLDCRGKA